MKSSIATSQGDIRAALAALDRAARIRPDDIRVQLGQAQAGTGAVRCGGEGRQGGT
jgi:cytochrome c-type biogenesis protein CcmH/NrfG